MNTQQEKVVAIFSAPGWSRFIDKLTGYRDQGRTLPDSVTLPTPTGEERLHHARLLRRPNPSLAGGLRYDLAKILAALQSTQITFGWDEILATLRGPIPAARLAARTTEQAWQVFWPRAAALVDHHPFPEDRAWLESLRRDTTLRRLSKGDVVLAARCLEDSIRLLHALPLPDDQPLASVAARYGGSSHALDPAAAMSTLVLRGLALRQNRSTPSRSDERRELWAAYRVVCDELSAPVLTFNLALVGDTVTSRLVALASLANQPVHLTSRILWATDWTRVICPPSAFVCENPTIVKMAADKLGSRCPPLVCVDGEPKPAARLLLRRLRAGGTALFYHGDFDWPGLAIAERIFREFGALPWCFDAESYCEAAANPGRPLLGKLTPSPWSPKLAETMHRVGMAYDEESLAEALLTDLDRRVSEN